MFPWLEHKVLACVLGRAVSVVVVPVLVVSLGASSVTAWTSERGSESESTEQSCAVLD